MNLNKIQFKKKYHLSSIDGAFGDGKTLCLTALVLNKDKEKKYDKIYSNYKINVNKNVKLDGINEYTIQDLKPNSALVIDEAYLYFDRRECNRKANTKTSQSLFQIRKLNIDVFVTIPNNAYIDLRYKELGNEFLHAFGEIDNIKEDGTFLYGYQTYNREFDYFNLNGNYFILDGKKYYDLYDTYEFVGKKSTLKQWQ